MPTFKHPCPYCGKFIDKISSACPYCGVVEPFAPKRCLNCRKIVEDPAWVVCPSCGASLTAPVAAAGATGGDAPAGASQTAKPAQPVVPPAPAPATVAPAAPAPAAGQCTGCGAPLPAGARFCTVCGTVAG